MSLRIAAARFIAAWFLVPQLRDWIPVWLPFLLLAALEVAFAGCLARARPAAGPRGRSPQEGDIDDLGGEEWLEPVLVEVEGHQVWLPTVDEDAEPRERRAPRPASRLRLRTLVVAGLAVLALVLFVLPDRGWDGLDEAEQRHRGAPLRRGGPDLGHTARVHCDAEGEAVGIVQHADGLAEVGGTNAYLTPEICFRLHRVTEGDEGPFSQTARAIAVLAHEAWHLRGCPTRA